MSNRREPVGRKAGSEGGRGTIWAIEPVTCFAAVGLADHVCGNRPDHRALVNGATYEENGGVCS